MNKKILLKMEDNKNIQVFRDDDSIITIDKDKRSISANKIFELFDYNTGDTYEIEVDNPNSLDTPVLNFFYDLIKEIADKLISFKEEKDDYDDIINDASS